jgi:predicted phage terminase large subunit-like protein
MNSQTIILPKLHQSQIEVQTNPARFKVVCAGRRWGKGVLGIGEAVRRAAAGQHCWWIAPSFASAAFQAGWRVLEFYAANLPGAQLHLQRRTLDMPGGGWVQFKTAEEADSLRGESIDFAVIDEAAHIRDLQNIWELCLRPCLLDRKGEAWFISTPAGHNFFHNLFQRAKNVDPGWASFQFPSTANPYLDAQELQEIGRDMPVLVKRQEIDAEFVQLAGALFKRDQVRILETEPAGVRWVRSWDLAFTTKTTSDYTAGLRVGIMEDGTVVIADVVRGRWEWPQAVRTVATTATADGVTVQQGVEVVGAQVGAIQTLLSDTMLAGLTFIPLPVHADKITRALPVIARCEQGKLAIVRGSWNKEFLDELASFPESKHDDQVDALSASMVMLSQKTGGWGAAEVEKFTSANPWFQQQQPTLDRERERQPFRLPMPGRNFSGPTNPLARMGAWTPRRWK